MTNGEIYNQFLRDYMDTTEQGTKVGNKLKDLLTSTLPATLASILRTHFEIGRALESAFLRNLIHRNLIGDEEGARLLAAMQIEEPPIMIRVVTEVEKRAAERKAEKANVGYH